MKTIEQAASELTASAHNEDYTHFVQDAFKKGVEFAQKWVSVDDKLPEIEETVILKYDKPKKDEYGETIYGLCVRKSPLDMHLRGHFKAIGVTHWRKIELK